VVLAQQAPGQITGLDLFPYFIHRFNARAQAEGLADRYKAYYGYAFFIAKKVD
jgi:hypothetical protein